VKQYVFKPSDIGRESWPSGELRLEGIEITDDPTVADLFVCPGALFLFAGDKSALEKFPYIKGKESRLICFDVSDHEDIFTTKDAMLIRCNLRKWMLEAHPHSLSFAGPVEDYAECIEVPEQGFKYDVSFQGWLSSDARKTAAASCNVPELKCDFAAYSDFTGYLKADDPELARRRSEFRRSMRESRLALCPESIPGVFPYRFFEACSAGRVPILICSGHVFPFADQIPYSEFIIEIPSTDAHTAASVAIEFLKTHSDAELIEMGLKARHYWEKFLDCRLWPKTMSDAVVAKLGALQCA